MKWNIFPSLRYHQENFHDMRCLRVMTTSSIQVSEFHIVVKYSFLFPLVTRCTTRCREESVSLATIYNAL